MDGKGANSALLVIDMQKVYLPENKWACIHMRNTIKNIEKRIKSFPKDHVFFTKFVASSTPCGIWKDYNKIYSQINSSIILNDYIDEFQKYITGENSFEKSTFSSLSNKTLYEKLNHFETIYVTGVISECCILSSIFSLIDMGKKVIYCMDSISGKNEETENAVITILKQVSPLHVIIE